jgi:acetyl esterase/lipase
MALRALLLPLLLLPGLAVADAPKTLGQVDTEATRVPELPVDEFFRHSEFDDIKISPTGEYLAASVKLAADTGALVVLRRETLERTGVFRLAGRSFVSDFRWVGPERLLFGVAESQGSKTNPGLTGEIYGMDADGRNQKLLIGPRAETRSGRFEVGFLNATLPDDDDHVLVSVRGIGAGRGTDFPRLERMNVRTGSRSLIARAPIANASFLADQAGKARLSWGADENNRQKVYYREAGGGEWRVIHEQGSTDGPTWTPRFVYPDGASALIEMGQASGPNGLFRYRFADGETTLVARDTTVDPWFVAYALDRSAPVAVAFMDGGPKLTLLDRESPLVKGWASVLRGVEGTFSVPTSWTDDGNLVVFRVFSDRNPGEFHLLDRGSMKLTYLMSSRRWIKPEQMATMEPVSFKARDGLTIHGYLTIPPNSDGRGMPLVLNPHGGPIGPFDTWGWNPETQLFANRGYATLQVNFRGSGNYGEAFTRAGLQQWGDGMIDDMTDAVRWAIAEGIADPERICIYGASYGGYAAAMAPIREPNLYRCAVGYVGVYDMPFMFASGDIPDLRGGRNFLREWLGTGAEFLTRISPVHRAAAELKVPMFIVTGNEDERAPPEHSQRLRRVLTEAGRPPQWMERDFEGHGFFKLENNRALYTEMLAFFDAHIGASTRGESGKAAEAAVSSP